jgi:flagellar biosynthesis/type III secretory pathway protein FliH
VSARDVKPFLPVAANPTRPLGAALPALATVPAASPWAPRHEPTAPPVPSADDIATLQRKARDTGRAEGLAETAALRGRLAMLIDQLAAARLAIVPPAADAIAEIATCVVESWIGTTHRSAMFAPIVRGFLSQAADQPATARVHPDDAAAIAEAIGEAPLAIATDPQLARGALEIRGATLELVHAWQDRLAELRTAIVAALTGVES